jgi:hypothetical protein
MKRLRHKMVRQVSTLLLCLVLANANAQGGNDWMTDMFGYFQQGSSVYSAFSGIFGSFEDGVSFEDAFNAACTGSGTYDSIDQSADSAQVKNYACLLAGMVSGLSGEDLSVSNLLDAACQVAPAVEGAIDGEAPPSSGGNTSNDGSSSGGEQKVTEVACGVLSVVENIASGGENLEAILETYGKDAFVYMLTNLSDDVTAEQAQALQQVIAAAVNGEVEDLPGEIAAIGENYVKTKIANLENASEGTSESVLKDIATLVRSLKYQIAQESLKQAGDVEVIGQSQANHKASEEIARRETEDTTMQKQHEIVTEDVTPILRQEATTSVSTRATVQTVVNAITQYMEQDSANMSVLNGRLVQQIQQQAHTNHQLYLLVQSLKQESLEESQRKEAQLEQQLNAQWRALSTSINQFYAMTHNFGSLGNTTWENIAIAQGLQEPDWVYVPGISSSTIFSGQ